MPPAPDPAESDVLRRFLAERDVPCPACGYNLRGLAGDRCPECDQHLALQVALTEPKLGSFVAGIVALSIGPGACLVFLGLAAVEQARRPSSIPAREIMPLLCGALFGAMAIPLWNRKRRLFLSADGGSRWLLVIGAAVVGFAFPVWFFLVVR